MDTLDSSLNFNNILDELTTFVYIERTLKKSKFECLKAIMSTNIHAQKSSCFGSHNLHMCSSIFHVFNLRILGTKMNNNMSTHEFSFI